MKLFLLVFVITEVRSVTEYNVPLLGHGSTGELYDDTITLQIVNPGTTIIYVTVDTGGSGQDSSSFTVNDKNVNMFSQTLNNTVHPVNSQRMNYTIIASSDDYFGLQVITTVNGYSEGYQAIPNSQLGTEYYASTMCDLGEFCQLLIGSTVEGTTQVYVELPPEVDEVGFCIGNGTWFSDTSTTITLFYPQTVQLETTHDLTGTRIYADNNVSVIAGSRTPNIAVNVYHLVEQLVPVSYWGTEFFVRPVGSTAYGNTVHITSRYRRTYVSMTGHPRVELTGPGQTIKRRIDPTIEIRIQATRVVQVVLYTGFTYASNETITKPGMTLVPAVEHYMSKYDVTCDSTSIDTTSWQFQIVAPDDVTVSGLSGGSAIHNISYDRYEFIEYNQNIGSTYTCINTNSGLFSGIMNCKGSAIFPLGVLSKQSRPCSNTEDIMDFGDGIDNDCDGSIDEDYCFENKRFETAYTITNGDLVPSDIHVENILGWSLINLRIKSCGDVKLELLTYNANNNVTGKFVISISKIAFTIYKCSPSCDFKRYRDTSGFLQDVDCNTLVPYWILSNGTHICFDIGTTPYGCNSQDLEVGKDSDVTELALHGLYSNAVFYFDVQRTDCGGLYSDWRCVDLVTNCWEYEDDLCTTYADWSNVYCRKFCHICTPDAIGRIFTVKPPENTVSIEFYAVPKYSPVNYMSVNNGVTRKFEDYTVTLQNGTISTIMKSSMISIGIQEARKIHTIYSDASVHLFAKIDGHYGTLTIPVYPLDAFGTEYMTVSFSSDVACDIIPGDGPAEVWKSTRNETTYLGVIDSSHVVWLSGNEGVGTVFNSSRPVAVFCAHKENSFVQHWTQIFPTNSLGNMYIIPSIASNESAIEVSAKARIVTNNANTRVKISGDYKALYILENRGDYKDETINMDSNYTIVSNYPISIGILYTDRNSGSTSFVIIPPVDNYAETPVMMFPTSNSSYEFSIVTDSGDFLSESVNHTSDLLYYAEKGFSYAIAEVSNGTTLGRQFYQSTFLVKDLVQDQTCTITKMTPGDGIDNDCDGLIDEELVCFTGYGSSQKDYDLDGWFGEDCLGSTEVIPANVPPVIPTCYTPPPTPENSSVCLTLCQCSCNWTESLAIYENMSQAEKDAVNLARIKVYRKALKIETEILSATIAVKESAEDSRTSSQNIGYVGIVLLTLVAGLVVFFDLVNIFQYFSNKRKTAVVGEY